ncbi:GMC oxidoreductase [Algicella marina]|uniref:Glucose-methanol-choline oxidoreductase n=1 Tax=Algicella marina TaxID=2683284 RepID=A0A6P1SXM0_9RHOB|nr:GMC family oxidoreductase [Algicella marina]QHQ34083.1 glucose-methanol-choline oxidoreductase [Algicella marina]
MGIQQTAAELAERHWDVIVIGTGIGGGTLGRRLAEAGRSVLFLEFGQAGYRREQQGLDSELGDRTARELRGYWPVPMRARIDGRESTFYSPTGAGVGGSSVFYAASLERPEPHDLDDSPERPHPTGGWPVSYADFAPYLTEAERMYHVCGTPDPLGSDTADGICEPPDMTTGDVAMLKGLEASGLHPYRVHMGLKYLRDCQECIGFKCPRSCKMDGRSAGVEPALATGRASLLTGCRVRRLEHADGRVQAVVADVAGGEMRFHADEFVLAAGALSSPRVLLASKSEEATEGLGNSAGLVGRGLMFHLNEMIALWPKRGTEFAGPTKALALRDFYYREGARFGSFQAMGVDATYGSIVHFLNGMFDRSFLRRFRTLREFTRIPAAIAAKLFGDAKIFTGILEDLPYPENRVLLSAENPDEIIVEYNLARELLERRRKFRRAIRKGLKGHRFFFLGFGPELNFGHPCGTLPFGAQQANSVLDMECRVHGVANLTVADASFMPTSTGVNPSLTIAANALRVADCMLARGTVEMQEAV